MKLLLGVVVELFVAVSVAGGILALLIPALSGGAAEGGGGVVAGVSGVLLVSVAVALFRPGSTIRRYAKR